ncbi:MAG: S1/P1 nuclease [Alistipes sp.]|nr:S1/P1 nuclease [Alistipes sp.]
MRKLVFTLMAALLPSIAFAWGQKGHDVVANIAEQHISKRAKAKIERVLDGHSMVYVANWMDNASHTPDYSYTKTWHYCNADASNGGYAEAAKNEKGDVVVAITDIVTRLKSGELSADDERVALMMLIHLVGDLHCPMHAGRAEDLGGNRVKVSFFGKKTNLHSVWDSDIVESAHRWSYSEWQQQIDRVERRVAKSYVQGDVVAWYDESLRIAATIYEATPEDSKLSYDYVGRFRTTIEEQLLKGGLRLAALLEEIY